MESEEAMTEFEQFIADAPIPQLDLLIAIVKNVVKELEQPLDLLDGEILALQKNVGISLWQYTVYRQLLHGGEGQMSLEDWENGLRMHAQNIRRRWIRWLYLRMQEL